MNDRKERQNDVMGASIAIGAGGGVAIGVVLMKILGPGYFAAGIAIGVTLGVAVGSLVGRRLK